MELWLELGNDVIPMRKWGGIGRLNKISSAYGMVLDNRFGLCSPGVGSGVVDGAVSIRSCKIGEGRRGKSGVGGLVLRIMRGPRLLDEVGSKETILSLWK